MPDLEAFLPRWIARLESCAKKEPSDWESDHDRWLRVAIGRRDGIAGLARLARTTKRTEAARAWCAALVEKRDWRAALAAYEECAALVEKDYSRGDFLDGAALAAQELGRKDLPKKLEAAWLGAPSLLRLVRWLAHGTPTAATLRKRAATAIAENPTKSQRIIGFLNLIVGDVNAAAQLLSKAPGLGWSQGDHPAHLLFAAFAWLLGGAPEGSVRGELAAALHSPLRGDFDLRDAEPSAPKLTRPTTIGVLQRAYVTQRLTADNRKTMLEAMKTAAARRTDGVLGEKRRRHYEHAAMLIACCVELEAELALAAGVSAWAEALRTRASRFPAFQEQLRSALAQARRMAER